MDKITMIEENLSAEERIRLAKEFLGLRPEQSFQDLECEGKEFKD